MNDLSSTPAVPAPVIQRTDYRPPEWLVPEIALDFALSLTATKVRADLVVERGGAAHGPCSSMAMALPPSACWLTAPRTTIGVWTAATS